MTEKERISQLEEMFSEILLKVDRIGQDVSTQRTGQLQIIQILGRHSDNIEFLLQKSLKDDEWKQSVDARFAKDDEWKRSTDEWKQSVDAKFEMVLRAIESLKK